jgi:hypothetical protein
MKITMLILTFLSFAFFACQTPNSVVNSENKTVVTPADMNSQTNSSKKNGDLEITFKIEASANRALKVAYTVKNNGAGDYVVFDQGHTNRQERDVVYVEETGGAIEFSRKAFLKPTGVMCPNSLVPIRARGSLLKSGGELSGQAIVQNAAQTFTPYDFCVAPKPIDAKITQAKFCLGAAQVEGAKIDEQGNIENVNSLVAKQIFLCSDSINLEN